MVSYSLFRKLLLAALIALTSAPLVAQDSADYSVRIPPFMSLNALRPDQTVNHPGSTANVVLNSSMWLARTASNTGSTVTFSTDHAFWNLSDTSYKRDAILRSPRMFATRRSGWAFDTASDQTDLSSGDEIATIQISSTGPGTAIIFLEVEFVTGDLATLKGGDYQLTVTGTISEN